MPELDVPAMFATIAEFMAINDKLMKDLEARQRALERRVLDLERDMPKLAGLIERLAETSMPSRLMQRIDALAVLLRDALSWQYDAKPEYGPVLMEDVTPQMHRGYDLSARAGELAALSEGAKDSDSA